MRGARTTFALKLSKIAAFNKLEEHAITSFLNNRNNSAEHFEMLDVQDAVEIFG